MKILVPGFSMNELVKGEFTSIDFVKVDPKSQGVMVIHNHTDEVIFPIMGVLTGFLAGQRKTVKQGDCIKIKRGTPHKFNNETNAEAGFISVCCPPFSIDDVIIIEEEKVL